MNFSSIVAIIIIILIIVLVIKNYKIKLSKGCCGAGDSETIKKNKVKDKNEANYKFVSTMVVEGIFCSNCTKRVENALNSFEGVWATVESDSKTVKIRMKELVEDSELKKVIMELKDFSIISLKHENY